MLAIATAPWVLPTPPLSAQSAPRMPACEWCGATEAPAMLGSSMVLAPPGEPGVPLVVTGRVFQRDGRTPAGNVLLYAYHTNATGRYAMRGDETGNGLRHGYLRGWLRTNARGEYRIVTIHPAPYPGREGPAHIHMTVTRPGGAEQWVDSVVFDDDPLLTPESRARRTNVGGSGIVHPTRGADGVQRVVRDIVLADVP
jgi:protocatechuate 3,4-dioxygenase beta subunit